jgi:hypothetical protein
MSEQQSGGKRKVKKTTEPKPVAKKAPVPAPASKSARTVSRKPVAKKGGAIVDDVKTLAVPFAILLDKEGLNKLFKEKKSASTSSLSPKAAATPSSTRRRSTLSGGSCNLGCGVGGQMGGAAARELFNLQKSIDNFLQKY